MNRQTAICTLFEGNYHYGLGVLANSLYRNGFRGTIWAGYRGDLPFWVDPCNEKEGVVRFEVSENCHIHFLALKTAYHFTNYKPTFMLELWEKYCPEADGLIYFDPDIVVKCPWSFFEDWIEDHVGLCEDVNSPLNYKAPKRLGWQKVLGKHKIELPLSLDIYANGGFVGLPKKHLFFLKTWKSILDIVGQEAESLEVSFLPSVSGKQSKRSKTDLFYIADQDALNCAAMKHSEIVAMANRDAMDFDAFGDIMSHAVGPNKPWNTKYLTLALDGRRISNPHKLFWKLVDQPIRLYSKRKMRWQNFKIKLASFITNFYSRL